VSEPERIGVFGGTFDPVHQTHIDIATAARDQARLDLVLFVVASIPPHKRHEVEASAEDRFAMVEAALQKERGFEASRLELERVGPSYTVDTLMALREQYRNAALLLILGEDSLADFPRWHSPERILEYADLLIVPRPGSEAEIPPGILRHCHFLEFQERPVSSTEIRDRIRTGTAVDGIVPLGVQKIILERGLYGAYC
jgi:nicotinate-nucleotide adenylyltransferase